MREKRGNRGHDNPEAHVCMTWFQKSRNGLNEMKESHRKSLETKLKRQSHSICPLAPLLLKDFFLPFQSYHFLVSEIGGNHRQFFLGDFNNDQLIGNIG